jgi:membrane fusion protein, heavy metal efflux system
MFIKYKLFITLLLSVLISFSGCRKEETEQKEEHSGAELAGGIVLSPSSIMEIGLQTKMTALKSFTEFITVPAKVMMNQDNEAQVGSLVQGRVNKVFVQVGDYVQAGQALMLVEGLEIGVIKAGYLKAKANLDFVKADYERHKLLSEQNIGSKQMFYEAQAEYEKAAAEYNAEDKKIHSIGLDDEDVLNGKSSHVEEHTSGTLAVKSPIGGIVVERNVVIGQWVDGTTNAFKIINTASVWVDGQIYEKDMSRATEKTGAVFTSSSYPDEKFTGRVSYVGQIVDEQSRTLTIRARFNNPNGKLKPNMFGELQIPAGINAKSILIPAESVIKIDNADYVFVQKNDSTFEKRAVVIGSTQNEMIQIRDGLLEQERVVVKGAFFLKSEMMKGEFGEEGD